MDEAAIIIYYILLVLVIMIVLRVFCTMICRSHSTSTQPRIYRRIVQRIRINPSTPTENTRDREGNIFTISDDATLNNSSRRYPEFFYYDQHGTDSVRFQAQLEKDDKDLPSYEEVMRCSNILTPTALAANTTDEVRLTVPPYSEIDPLATMTQSTPMLLSSSAGNSEQSTIEPTHLPSSNMTSEPSTSRAAAEAAIISSVRNM